MKRMTWLLMLGVAAFSLATLAGEGKGGEKGARFKKADADADGKLSATEFATICDKGDADKKFAAADTDKDGFLSKDELKAAHKSMGGKGGGAKGDGQKPCDKKADAPKT